MVAGAGLSLRPSGYEFEKSKRSTQWDQMDFDASVWQLLIGGKIVGSKIINT